LHLESAGNEPGEKKRNYWTGPSVWEPLHENIRGSKLVLLPDLGHVIDMEAPELFNAEVRAFLFLGEHQ